jgi:hypothetical protein
MDAIDSEFKDAPSLLTGPLLYEERFRRQERAEKRRLKAQSKPKAKPKAKPKPEGKRNEEIDGMTIAQRIIARSRGVK